MFIESQTLKAVAAPGVKTNIELITAAFNMYNDIVVTPLQMAHFWAQAMHETGGLRWLVELGGRDYFKKYDFRSDLGNNEPGDGYFFRGRGIFHLTGRYNYSKVGRELNLDLVHKPDMAAQEDIATLIALHYWKVRDLNRFADNDDIYGVTRSINGGTNGFADRHLYLKRMKQQLELASKEGPFDDPIDN